MFGQGVEKDVCPRPRAGSIVPEPADLRSENGVLTVELTYTNFRDALGQMHYCYRDGNGSQAPNLRLHPGDWLVLTLKNELRGDGAAPHQHAGAPTLVNGACGTGAMDGLSTNLHFHGVNVAPVCQQDDVLHTLISRPILPLNTDCRFQRTNRRAFTGITRMSTERATSRCRAAHLAL
jgi:FtsP/CotA-like multicopper oxidase with cupredoxin domain